MLQLQARQYRHMPGRQSYRHMQTQERKPKGKLQKRTNVLQKRKSSKKEQRRTTEKARVRASKSSAGACHTGVLPKSKSCSEHGEKKPRGCCEHKPTTCRCGGECEMEDGDGDGGYRLLLVSAAAAVYFSSI